MPVDPLVEEATRRSGLVWVALDGHRPQAIWHLWYDDALWLVCGGREQQLAGAEAATRAVVTVRSKATQNDRLVSWVAAVSRLLPTDPQWADVAAALHATRSNAPDGEEQPARWAGESIVLRLVPTGETVAATADPELAPPADRRGLLGG